MADSLTAVSQPRHTRFAPAVFLAWYFGEMPLAIVNSYGEYFKAFWEIFSFPFLVSTLLCPWKNVLDPYPKNHLDFSGVFQSFCLNMMSRAIGCVFRLVMIAIGIVVHVSCFVLFMTWLAVWMLYPFMVLLGAVYLIHGILVA